MHRSRVFIADALCAVPYWHNSVAVNSFAARLGKTFETIIPLVCEEFPRDMKLPPGTDYAFRFYYESHVRLPQRQSRRLTPAQREGFRDWRDLTRRTLRQFMGRPSVTDSMLARAKADWKQIIHRHQIGKADIIFFPTVDYYGLRGLFLALAERPRESWPLMHLHFINAPEHFAKGQNNPMNDICYDLRCSGMLGRRIFLSAEVAAYARELSPKLNCAVTTLDFPLVEELIPLPARPPYVVGVIGAGRRDKGYFRLADIISQYNESFNPRDTLFRIQGMPSHEYAYRPDYEEKLRALPNVEMLASFQPTAEMKAQYARSHLLLLPYSEYTYRQRGSAVTSEAIAFGRPVVVSGNTAFAETVQTLRLGMVCQTDAEFAAAIAASAATQNEDIWPILVTARNTYIQAHDSGMERICRELLVGAS